MAYNYFARFYDLLTQNVDYKGRAGYFHQLIQTHLGPAELVLDLACGTGSLSLELAALGYDVIGADASREMLSVAMQKAGDKGQEILFLCQAMEKLDLYGTVDVCICALDSLNHLPDQSALERVFGRVSLFLNPGGLFLFDMNTSYKHRELLGDNAFVYELPQVYCVWQNSLSQPHDTVTINLDFFQPKGRDTYIRQSEEFRERIFDPETVARLLERSGLRLEAVYGDDTLEPPGERTQRLIYVANK